VPTPIRLVEFAQFCAAIYHEDVTEAAGFTRNGFHRNGSGFQGAYFVRHNGMATDFIVTVAGTQPTDTMGADIVADADFGGVWTGGAAGLANVLPGIGPVLSSVLGSSGTVLAAQVRTAQQMVRLARQAARTAGSRVFITGHSLGGGIAQIVAASSGMPAVAISAPAVTAVPGVEAASRRNSPDVCCLRIRHDPINETGRIAAWLGRVTTLPSRRTGGDAHSIDQTVTELLPSGEFSSFGGTSPF
jgi:hypothetical protein